MEDWEVEKSSLMTKNSLTTAGRLSFDGLYFSDLLMDYAVNKGWMTCETLFVVSGTGADKAGLSWCIHLPSLFRSTAL